MVISCFQFKVKCSKKRIPSKLAKDLPQIIVVIKRGICPKETTSHIYRNKRLTTIYWLIPII